MAWSTVETKIQNPASGRGKVRKMAARKRKFSAKQIKAGFGGKRRQNAAKSGHRRKRSASAKRHRPATKKRANPTRKRAVARSKRTVHRKRAVARKRTVKRRRSNPGEIVSFVLGNPAKRRKKAVAHSKRRRKAAARRNPAGRRRRAVMTRKRRGGHRRRSNPGALGSTGSWVVGGVGILGGVVVTRALPQLVLGSGNTGPIGYAANAAVAVAGGFLLNSIGAGRKFAIPFVGGGFAALIARLISDYTPYGKALSLSGWGDYQFSNIVGTVPQRVINMNSAVTEWGAPGDASRAMSRGGTDMGVRSGNC